MPIYFALSQLRDYLSKNAFNIFLYNCRILHKNINYFSYEYTYYDFPPILLFQKLVTLYKTYNIGHASD